MPSSWTWWCHPAMYHRVVDKLYRADVAALVGILPTSLGRAKLPPPDGYDIESGHARPWWRKATAQEWKANRPGRGNWRRSRSG